MNNIKVVAYTQKHLVTIKFEESKFPGGELHVRIGKQHECDYDSFNYESNTLITHGTYRGEEIERIIFKVYYKNDIDLMRVALMKNALQNLFGYKISYNLWIPYHPYARQDRVCADGDAFSLQVVVNLINSIGFDKVYVSDPHSNVLAGMYPAGVLEIRTQDLLLSDVIRTNCNYAKSNHLVLIAPDEGAFKKTEAMLDKFTYSKFAKVSMVRCFKKRDPLTGKILSVESLDEIPNEPVTAVVVDDICDGGGTFIALIDSLKDRFNESSQFYLCVTHGIFSKGVDVLKEHGYTNVFAANDLTQYNQPY